MNILSERKFLDKKFMTYKENLYFDIDNHSPEITKMLEYIHVHLFESNLTVTSLKRDCCLTNNNIATRFRYEVGTGPKEYIQNIRLNAAVSILKDRKICIYLLANAIGYTEEAFSKLFKKTYGVSPLNYRKNYLREMNKKFEQEKILREKDKLK